MIRQEDLERRARDGGRRSQMQLAPALWTGTVGIEEDPVHAYAWLRAADAQGMPCMTHAIGAVYEEMLARSHDAIDQALALAEEFCRRHCPAAP